MRPGLHGFVLEDPAGDYNIYINIDDPEQRQIRTLVHEVGHIQLGHLHDDIKTTEEKEQEASYEREANIPQFKWSLYF